MKRLVLLSAPFLLLFGFTLARAQEPPASPRASAPPAPPAAVHAHPATPAPHAALYVSPPAAPQSPGETPEPSRNVTYFFYADNFLGVYTEEVTKENAGRYNLREPRGVGVKRVVKDSPAERAGLREGDVILRFDGEAVASIRKLNRLIDESAPEHTARLSISRGGSEQELSVKLANRRDAPGAFRGDLLPPGPEAEEWKRFGEEMKKSGEQLRKQMEEWKRDRRDGFTLVGGTRRRIGVTTTRLTEQLADYFGVERGRGLLVTSVAEGSAAAKAGLKAGDVITEAEGERVSDTGDLSRAINRQKEGEISLTVVRERKSRTVRLTPDRVKAQRMELFSDDWPDPSIAVRLPGIRLPSVVLPRIETPRVTLPAVEITPRIRIPAVRIRPSRIRDGVLL